MLRRFIKLIASQAVMNRPDSAHREDRCTIIFFGCNSAFPLFQRGLGGFSSTVAKRFFHMLHCCGGIPFRVLKSIKVRKPRKAKTLFFQLFILNTIASTPGCFSHPDYHAALRVMFLHRSKDCSFPRPFVSPKALCPLGTS